MTPPDPTDDPLHTARHTVTSHALLSHALSPAQARIFMQHHVFAVWDFMALLKRLQRELTCVSVPWFPPRDAEAARLINEIVLAEESDEDGRGGHSSHFEIYLTAMREVDADTRAIDGFLTALAGGESLDAALRAVPEAAADFVRTTLDIARNAPVCAVAAAFLHGREAIIPAMFTQLLRATEASGAEARTLRHYLQRHVELDGDTHGPLAEALLVRLVTSPAERELADGAAMRALEARARLWDGVWRAVSAAS